MLYEAIHYNFKPSDGVVFELSGKAFPGATQVRLIGSNHQQMRNDSNTKRALNELFDGDHGAYFVTPVQ